MRLRLREEKDGAEHVTSYVDPSLQLNLGLWFLFAGATVLLFLRVWVKVTRRHGLWYDDYILITSWAVLLTNNALISHQYATGYVTQNGAKWDDRMHILINITSCLTLIGQAWTKTAFGVTLLKLSNKWQQYVLWFCIITMNGYMVAKVIFQWAKLCDEKSYNMWYRLDFCVDKKWRNDFKEGGNVYNIIMDFAFALFPWIITWKLDMRRHEKIVLCATMSLGMLIAIVSAVRTGWKDSGNKRDPDYYWRNALSNIWFSSEVAGTIMVQCIPVLRPFLRVVTGPAASKRMPDKPIQPKTPKQKTYEPTPLSRWESSQARASRPNESSYGESIINAFDFDFKRSQASSASQVELVSWNHEEKDFERELEKELYMDENGKIGILPSISEDSEGERKWEGSRV